MSDISKIDKNFEVKPLEVGQETVFFDCLEEPFKIFGLIKPKFEGDIFRRMPNSVASEVSEGVASLSRCTAGGRVKFKTNSPYVCIKAEMPHISRMPHFTLCGSAGFDLYKRIDGVDCFCGTFVPPNDIKNGYESKVFTGGLISETEFTVHFPLYSYVKSLEIGLKAGSILKPVEEYNFKMPVVYYGSSITQGGCASRPGMAYQNIISRELNCDHINLGFSGNALGEDKMAEYIAALKMSAFVYDYDHNAPSVEHLKATHQRFFDIIREKNPELPIIMASMPKYPLMPYELPRREVIRQTYKAALEKGDENVYFIDGSEMMKFKGGNEATVDNCHPTDLGFRRMADVIGEAVGRVLKK